MLQDEKAIAAFLEEVSRFVAGPPDDDVIAYYALMRYLYGDNPPKHLREPMQRIQESISQDADLADRLDRFAARITQAERQSDALAHFEALTGHRLESPKAPQAVPESRQESQD